LIANIDFITRIATACYMRPYLDKIRDSARDIPSKYGYQWLYGGANEFIIFTDDGTKNYIVTDKGYYDASASGWGYTLYRDHVLNLCDEIHDSQFFYNIIDWHSKPTRIYLSDGTILKQVVPGVMKSGAVFTIDKNSSDQVDIRLLFDIRRGLESKQDDINATGDDTIEHLSSSAHEEYVSFQNSLGFSVKEYASGYLTDLDFVGKRFRRIGNQWHVVPAYYNKNKWALMVKEKNSFKFLSQTLRSYCIEYAMSEHFSEFYGLLQTVGEPSDRASESWFKTHHFPTI
jgi:hypothetical protein